MGFNSAILVSSPFSRAWVVVALSASGKKHDLSIGRITREGKRENSLPSIESWFLSRFTRYYACKTWLDRTTNGDDFEEELKVGKGCLITYMFEDSFFFREDDKHLIANPIVPFLRLSLSEKCSSINASRNTTS